MGNKRIASTELETFIDEAIRLAKERGYNPTTFQAMRQQYGTVEAIEKLVQSGEMQSGFRRLKQLNPHSPDDGLISPTLASIQI